MIWVRIVLFVSISHAVGAQHFNTVPYRKGNLWGFADIQGRTIIEPVFEMTFPFTSDSLARIKQKGLFGYIDKTGKFRISPAFSEASDFYLGIAKVRKNNKAYCINLDGSEDECHTEYEEEEVTKGQDDFKPFTIFQDSTEMGLIILSSMDTIKDSFEDVTLMNRYFFPQINYFAVVRKKGNYGVYNQHGILIIPPEYKQIEILDFNSYKAIREKTWGVNTFTQENVIPFEYDSITKHTEIVYNGDQLERNDFYIVSRDSKTGVIDGKGKLILKLEYDAVSVPKACTCPIEFVISSNGLSGLANSSGEVIVSVKYKSIIPFYSSEVTYVQTPSGQGGYIHKNGMEYFSD